MICTWSRCGRGLSFGQLLRILFRFWRILLFGWSVRFLIVAIDWLSVISITSKQLFVVTPFITLEIETKKVELLLSSKQTLNELNDNLLSTFKFLWTKAILVFSEDIDLISVLTIARKPRKGCGYICGKVLAISSTFISFSVITFCGL